MTTAPPSPKEFYEGLPSCQLRGHLSVPASPGVYIMCSPMDILYIGAAANLLNRIGKQGHIQRSGIVKLWGSAIVKWYASDECADKSFRIRLESALIAEFAPLLNVPGHAWDHVNIGLSVKVTDRLRSQAWRRDLPLTIWAGMVLGSQSELGFDGKLY